MDHQTGRVSIEAANKILGTFGVKESRKYERWLKEYGFDLKDFDSVLFESPFIFIIDWRASLEEELERVVDALGQLDVQLELELDEDGDSGFVVCGDKRAKVAYRPNDTESFDPVFRALQSVVPTNIEFQSSPLSEGSDTYVYAVLPADEWADLRTGSTKEIVEYFFCALK